MLKFIEPQSHHLYQTTINAFLNLLEHYHDVSFSPELLKKATFVIGSSKAFSLSETKSEGEIYGGAVFYPQKIPSTLNLTETDTDEETVIKLTSFFQPKGEEYWTARICLCLEQGTSAASILETQDICHRFYKDLYPAFTEFGEEHGIDYLAYTLRIAETYNIKTYESWPYQLGVSPAGSHYDYIHGILSLKGKAFQAKRVKAQRCHKSGRPS